MVDTVVFFKVLIALSGCVIIISAINYWLDNDKQQEIQSISIGCGILFCSLILWLYFNKYANNEFSLLLYIGTFTPVVGGSVGLIGLKLFRYIYDKHRKKLL